MFIEQSWIYQWVNCGHALKQSVHNKKQLVCRVTFRSLVHVLYALCCARKNSWMRQWQESFKTYKQLTRMQSNQSAETEAMSSKGKFHCRAASATDVMTSHKRPSDNSTHCSRGTCLMLHTKEQITKEHSWWFAAKSGWNIVVRHAECMTSGHLTGCWNANNIHVLLHIGLGVGRWCCANVMSTRSMHKCKTVYWKSKWQLCN